MADTWSDILDDYVRGEPMLFDNAFLQLWGGQEWNPTGDDKKAAARLHTQIISRITTQRLGYLDGVEKTALDSVYALFAQTRTICDELPDAFHFRVLAWYVL